MKGIIKFFGVLVIFAIIFIFGALFFEVYLTSEIVEVKVLQLLSVQGKYNAVERYVVTPNETFDNNDNYYHKKTNSAEIQKKLKRNRVYKFKVVGYKFRKDIPFFFSNNRNIVEVVN
ncbi:MAG: hypothetical protein PVH88_11960 [Ignavibacteria bacterium]|jgi:hypothetical protein